MTVLKCYPISGGIIDDIFQYLYTIFFNKKITFSKYYSTNTLFDKNMTLYTI